jgi:hypothetical protein
VFGSLPGFLVSPCLAATSGAIPVWSTFIRRHHQPIAIGIVRAATGLPAGVRKSYLPVLHPAANRTLRPGLLENYTKLHSGLWPPLHTGYAIRALNHV